MAKKKNSKLSFEDIFEDENIKPEMKSKISEILTDVVNKKVNSRLSEEDDYEEDDEKKKKEDEKEVEEAKAEDSEDEGSKEDKKEDEKEVEEAKAEDSEDEDGEEDKEDEKEVEEAKAEDSEDEDGEEDGEEMDEAAASQAQQKLFGIAYAIRTGEMSAGELPKNSAAVALAKSDIKTKQLRDMAKTKLAGLPTHVADEKEPEDDMKNMEEQIEHIDGYLTFVAEEWEKQNIVAIENAIKVQLAESFLTQFNQLYKQFNITNVPDRDMVVEMTNKIVEAEKKLNEQMEKNAMLLKENNEKKKEVIVIETSKDLTETQKEKFKKLLENVTFEDVESYKQKITTIKETAFTKQAVSGDTKIQEQTAAQPPVINERINKYVDAISKKSKF